MKKIEYLYFSLNGRINRKSLWYGYLALVVVESLVMFLLIVMLSSMGINSVLSKYIVGVLFIYPIIALFIKRGHDLAKSGLETIILLFVPILNIWILIELFFFKGIKGDSGYGKDPNAK